MTKFYPNFPSKSACYSISGTTISYIKRITSQLKAGIFLMVMMLCSGIANSQSMSSYAGANYAASSGTFTPLTSANVVTTIKGDDLFSAAIPIGFDFFYMGTRNTVVYASSNGFLSFNSSIASSTATNNLATSSTTIRALIAPLWDDLDGTSTGTASYLTTGTPGNQVFTFEWLNWEWNYQANAAVVSFQVKLYEISGKIEFIYRSDAAAYNAGSTTGASVGLAAASTGSGNYVSLNSLGAGATSSTTAETNSISSKPTTGQIYTFLPSAPAAPTGLNFTGVTNSQMTLNWTDNATTEVGYTLYMSTDGTNYTYYGALAANSTSYIAAGLAPSTTYYWKVYAYKEALSTATSASQATSSLSCGGFITNNYTGPVTAATVVSLNTAGSWSLGHVPTACEDVTITVTQTGGGANTYYLYLTTAGLTCHNLTVTFTSAGNASNLKILNIYNAGFPLTITGDLSLLHLGANTGQSHALYFVNGTGPVTVLGSTNVGATGTVKQVSIAGGVSAGAGPWTFKGNLTYGQFGANNFPAPFVFDASGAQTLTNNSGYTVGANDYYSIKVGDVNNTQLTLAGTTTTFNRLTGGNLNISTGSSLILPATYTLNQSVASVGSVNLASGATLKLAGISGGQTGSNFPLNFVNYNFNAASTVEYNGAAQTVYNGVTYGNLTISTAGVKSLTGNLPAITGDLSVNSASTFDLVTFTANRASAGGTITINNTGLLKIGGTNTFPSNYTTHTLGATSTVEYSGGVQSVANESYGNLTQSASGNKDYGTGTTTIAGTLTVSGGTMVPNTSIVIFTGATGSMAGNNNKNFYDLQINSGATITTSGTGNISVNRNYTNNGTLTQTSTLTFNMNASGGASQAMSGTGTSTFGNFVIPNNAVVNVGSHSFSVGGTNFAVTSGSGQFNGGTGTVTMSGAVVIGTSAGAINFNNLTISGSLSDAINKNFSIAGNFANNGTYTAGTETITFNGTSGMQNFTATPANTQVSSITLNNANGLSLASANKNLVISSQLTLTNGKIFTLSSNALALTASAPAISGAGAARYIAGNLAILLPTGASTKKFEVGDASYAPVTLNITGATSGSNTYITAQALQAAVPTEASGCAGGNCSGINQSAKADHYWTLKANNANTGTYSAAFDVTNTINTGTVANYVARKYDPTAWTPTSSSVAGNVVTTTTGLSTASGVTSYFQVGEKNTLTVAADPSNSTICATANTSFTSTSSSAPTPTVQWQEDNGGGFANLSNGGVYSNVTTTTLNITGAPYSMNGYQYRAVFSNINGFVNSNPATLTVNPTVTAGVVTGTSPLCAGSTTTFSSTGTPGGAWSSTDPSKATVVSGTGVVTGLAAGSTNITYTVSTGCGSPVSSSQALTVSQCTNNWNGTGSWSDGTKWSLGSQPNQYQNVGIVTGTPSLDVDFTVGTGTTLTMSSPTAFIINPGKVFTVAGTANFAGQPVTVVSDATGTGSIGKITGTLSNATAVTVERFIPSTAGRVWRLVTIPVTGPQTVRQAWADNKAANPSAPTGESNNNRGTLLTGSGFNFSGNATAQGFDYWAAIKNTASGVRRYNGALSGSWPTASSNAGGPYAKSIPNLTLAEAAAERGFMLFVRGDRSVITGATNDTRLTPTGTLNTGTQSIAINTTDTFQLVGNPYASAIDFDSIYSHNTVIKNKFWRWDANNGSNGAYVLVNNILGTWVSTPTDDGPLPLIQSGQAILVTPTTYGVGGTLGIVENDKVGSNSVPAVFSPAPLTASLFSADLQLDNGTAGVRNADGVLAAFSSSYSHAGTDADDVAKANNFNENVALVRDGRRYTVEALPGLTAGEVLSISLANTTARSYAFRFRATNLASAGLTAYLEDSYTRASTPVSLDGGFHTVAFTVTADAASAAPGRFKVVFKQDGSLPVALTAKAYQMGSGVQVGWKTVNEQKLKSFDVEKSVNGTSFTKAAHVKAIGTASNSYGWLDAAPVKGTHYYRIKSMGTDGKAAYSQVMKVEIGGKQAGFAVYPNPVKTGVVSVQLGNLAKGTYTLVMHDAAGRQVMSQAIGHNGGSATETITLGTSLAAGMYKVSIGDMVQTVVIEK